MYSRKFIVEQVQPGVPYSVAILKPVGDDGGALLMPDGIAIRLPLTNPVAILTYREGQIIPWSVGSPEKK